MKRAPGDLEPAGSRLPALAWDGRDFFTRSAGGGKDVYGEVLRKTPDGTAWRRWDPQRSKVAAALHRGGLTEPWERLLGSGPLLYLGAASGTTVSHLADLLDPQAVFAVEFAERSFRELIENLKPWQNLYPLLEDASHPERYQAMVGTAGSIVQDVAQPEQVAILTENAKRLLRRDSPLLLFLKARSVDSSAEPAAIFRAARREVEEAGFAVTDERALEPYDLDHRAFLLEWAP